MSKVKQYKLGHPFYAYLLFFFLLMISLFIYVSFNYGFTDENGEVIQSWYYNILLEVMFAGFLMLDILIVRVKIIFDDENHQLIYRGLTTKVVDYQKITSYSFQDLGDSEYNSYEIWIYTNNTKLRVVLTFSAIRKRTFKRIYGEISQILNEIIIVNNKGET